MNSVHILNMKYVLPSTFDRVHFQNEADSSKCGWIQKTKLVKNVTILLSNILGLS